MPATKKRKKYRPARRHLSLVKEHGGKWLSDDFPVISLFSGAMGLDLGLEKAGLSIKLAQDVDPWCIKTMEMNNRNYLGGDIRELVHNDPSCKFIRAAAGLAKGDDIFAVVGGPPCQPFSTAGKRLSTNDPRGSLFSEFCHVVEKLQPRFFVMENVKGLLSVAINHVSPDQRKLSMLDADSIAGSAFKVIMRRFSALNYKLIYGVLDAANYGVPQFRERLVIIGSRDHEDIFLPEATHFYRHQDNNYLWKTLRSAVQDLEATPGPCATFSADRLRLLKMVPSGGNWRSLPSQLIAKAMGGAYESGGGKVGFFRRLDYDQPSPTLVTSPVQKATMLCHPTQDRPLSVQEYARIQQFPNDWKITGSVSDCYRQLGNAVPVGLAIAIGRMLVAVAEKSHIVVTKRFRGTSTHNILTKINRGKSNHSTDTTPVLPELTWSQRKN